MKLIVLKIEKIIEGEHVTLFPALIQNESHNYLVDCGYEETFEELKYELELSGVDIKDLTGVIITHDDLDHLGGLKFLKLYNRNLKVYCGEYEKNSVAGLTKSERLIQAENSLDMLPGEHQGWALEFIKKLQNIERFDVDAIFKDNEIFENELLIVHTPGHTQGHISLYLIKEKILIAGDAVVNEHGELNIANPNYTLDIETAVKSVIKIKKLNPAKIICYHGGILDKGIKKKLTVLIDKYKTTSVK